MKSETLLTSNRLSEWLAWGTQELHFLKEPEARQECEEMLGALTQVSRAELYLSAEPYAPHFAQFKEWIEARKKRTPLAYLLKKVHFWEDDFEVNEEVLIPRPETEVLIEAFLKSGGFKKDQTFHFLDLGTGSGVLGITLAKIFPYARGAALDLSEKALQVAKRNAQRIGVAHRLDFFQGDGLLNFREGSFDLIISNPPYVATKDLSILEPEVQKEPCLALDGGEEGLEFYQKIMRGLTSLKREGSLWVEIGWGQRRAVESLFQRRGFREVRVFKDLQGIDRVVSGVGFYG